MKKTMRTSPMEIVNLQILDDGGLVVEGFKLESQVVFPPDVARSAYDFLAGGILESPADCGFLPGKETKQSTEVGNPKPTRKPRVKK